MFLENGYAQIIGRIKETIIRGGENIEPKEIEEVLMKNPDIIDVQVATRNLIYQNYSRHSSSCYFFRYSVLIRLSRCMECRAPDLVK